MGTKRKHSELEGVHPSRQALVPSSSSKPTKKPRRIKPPPHKSAARTTSVNAIKKRIRDVKRRLERLQDLPADVRVENERALAAYEQELVAAEEEKVKQKMIKKYHMVRFFGMQTLQNHAYKLLTSHRASKSHAPAQKATEKGPRSRIHRRG